VAPHITALGGANPNAAVFIGPFYGEERFLFRFVVHTDRLAWASYSADSSG